MPVGGQDAAGYHPPGWCGRRDSNPHDFRHWNLNPARLPIPPRPRQRRACRGGAAYIMAQIRADHNDKIAARMRSGATDRSGASGSSRITSAAAGRPPATPPADPRQLAPARSFDCRPRRAANGGAAASKAGMPCASKPGDKSGQHVARARGREIGWSIVGDRPPGRPARRPPCRRPSAGRPRRSAAAASARPVELRSNFRHLSSNALKRRKIRPRAG